MCGVLYGVSMCLCVHVSVRACDCVCMFVHALPEYACHILPVHTVSVITGDNVIHESHRPLQTMNQV